MEPISRIDSSSNQLFFRGINAAKLCENSSFEEVLFLLIRGYLPSSDELARIYQKLIKHRKYYAMKTASPLDLAKSLDQFESKYGLDQNDVLLTFVSLLPLVVANEFHSEFSHRIEKPDNRLGHVSNFLWMTKCEKPSERDVSDFQKALVLHMDDPSNPSLSALNERILNGESISNALVAALEAHVGPLHHGAGSEAMRMLQDMKDAGDPAEYIIDRLHSGGKIFGLGHRIYRGKDPRAVVLEEILRHRVKNTSNDWLLHVIEQVSQTGHAILLEEKGVEAYPNVDLYNAAVYYSMGYPIELNTELFAVARGAGWIAHLNESLK